MSAYSIKPNKLGGQSHNNLNEFARDFPSVNRGDTLKKRVGSQKTTNHQQRREIPVFSLDRKMVFLSFQPAPAQSEHWNQAVV